MKKPKIIVWRTHPQFTNEIQGLLEDQEIFTIKPAGKNSNQFTLVSWAFKNETFNNSSNSKILGSFLSVDYAKEYAENKWFSFVDELLMTKTD